MRVLAFDPDLHHTGWAFVSDGSVKEVGTVDVPAKLTGFEATLQMMNNVQLEHDEWSHLDKVVIEGQQFYRPGRAKGNPNSLRWLAYLSGAIAGHALGFIPDTKVVIVDPADWKGQVPKHVHQARTYKRLGWPCEEHGGKDPYMVPTGSPFELKATQWKHVGDAIGLALWASK